MRKFITFLVLTVLALTNTAALAVDSVVKNSVIVIDSKRISKNTIFHCKVLKLDKNFYKKKIILRFKSDSVPAYFYNRLCYGLIEQYPHQVVTHNDGLVVDLNSRSLIGQVLTDCKNQNKERSDMLFWTLFFTINKKDVEKKQWTDVIAEAAAEKFAFFLKRRYIDVLLIQPEQGHIGEVTTKASVNIIMGIKHYSKAIVVTEYCFVYLNKKNNTYIVWCPPTKRSVPKKKFYALLKLFHKYPVSLDGYERCMNGACELNAGPIKIQYPLNDPENFKVDAPWKNTVNRQILKRIKKVAAKYDIHYDFTAPLLLYLVNWYERLPHYYQEPKIKEIAMMALRINKVLLNGDVSLLNEIITDFIKDYFK